MSGVLPLQSQGPEHLWSLELNRGKGGEGEGVCLFTRTFGKGTQDDLCRAGLEVSGLPVAKYYRTPYSRPIYIKRTLECDILKLYFDNNFPKVSLGSSWI